MELTVIDTNEKAYMLGFFASDCVVLDSNNVLTVTTPKSSTRMLSQMHFYLIIHTLIDRDKLMIDANDDTMVIKFKTKSTTLYHDICKHLHNETKRLKFPELESKELQLEFIKGFCDFSGYIKSCYDDNHIEYGITSSSLSLLESIRNFFNIPSKLSENTLGFLDTNAIDFLGILYKKMSHYQDVKWYEKYVEMTCTHQQRQKLPKCLVQKTDINAVIPSKTKESDAGYDLTVIKEHKKLSKMVTLYDTGIKICVHHGYYAEVVPRSSLSKSGYMLANSIGIIDRNYTGTILVALVKIDPDAQDIELPFRCCQLIFRRQVHMNIEEAENDMKIQPTTRDAGGFGSTGH
jgi:dUTP pyrophosphatase